MNAPRYVGTIDEVAKVLPRENGGIGVERRHAITLLKSWGIKKHKTLGWDIVQILEFANRSRRGKVAGDGSLRDEKLLREIKLLDIEIDERLGKTIPIEKHKETLQGVVAMMQSWWDKASEAAATKIKDATVLKHLREARERANDETMAVLDN